MDNSSDETRVVALLNGLAATEVAEFTAWPKEQPGWNPTPACPPIPRFLRAVLRGDWSQEELAHLQSCEYCTRLEAKSREAVWHPTVWQLFLSKIGRLESADAEDLAYHLETDGCCRCKLVVGSKLFGWIADLVRLGQREIEWAETVLRGALAGWARVQLAGGFASESRLPFQFRTVSDDGSLDVVARETDSGDLFVHVTSPDAGRAGQVVRVELIGAIGTLDAKEVCLKRRDGDGCGGHASFGRFDDVVGRLGGELAVFATIAAEATDQAHGDQLPPSGAFAPAGVLVRVRVQAGRLDVESLGHWSCNESSPEAA